MPMELRKRIDPNQAHKNVSMHYALGSIASGVRERLLALGCVRPDCSADQDLERRFIDLLALADIDGSPGIAVQVGVEQARQIGQRADSGPTVQGQEKEGAGNTPSEGGAAHRQTIRPSPMLTRIEVALAELTENQPPAPTPIGILDY